MEKLVRKTRSVCPVCRKNIPAGLYEGDDGSISLVRTCTEHGRFSVPVWRGKMDFGQWCLGAEELPEGAGERCPGNCGLCPEHETDTCCTLLEVTNRCNLRCAFCFANGGDIDGNPPLEELKKAVGYIVQNCGQPLIQFSGGEPTLRDDLPKLVHYAKYDAKCSYTQVNTNGIRLAEEPDYAKALKEAGLDIVFLQFDGTDDEIYKTLRGKELFETKKKCISVCSDLRIGVTLVPTVVRGVNDKELGNIVRFAAENSPGVRGVHFQPVSYFGRTPGKAEDKDRYTLDELVTDISDQAGIPVDAFLPSRCDHPLCGFHSDFLIERDKSLKPLSDITHSSHTKGCAVDNREYVASRWMRPDAGPEPKGDIYGEMDFDTFLYRLRNGRLTLSAMAFQDAGNLNIERLHRCSLHVYDKGRIMPFCARYL